MKTPSRIKALETLASEIIGDSKAPNLFFVTDRGSVVTVTRSFESAHSEWSRLALRRPLVESGLEDRKTGTIASVSPESEGGRLIVWDDSKAFGYR